MNTHDIELRSAVMVAITDVWDRAKQIDDAADEVLDLIEAAYCKRRDSPVGILKQVAMGEPVFYPLGDNVYELPLGEHQLYAAPQSAKPVKINAIFEAENGEVIGTTDAKVKRVEWQDDGSLTVVIDYWPQPSEPVQITAPIGYITPSAVNLLREGRFVSLCPTDIDGGLPVNLDRRIEENE